MSLDGNRCINCGARMKLVNVTRINTFRTPEASQYDLSVARRHGAAPIQSSSRELLCTCCGYRLPAGMAKTLKPVKEKKVKEKAQKDTSKKDVEKKKDRTAFWVKLFIFLAIVAVAAYFAYKYRGTIMEYYGKFMGLLDKARGFIDKFRK